MRHEEKNKYNKKSAVKYDTVIFGKSLDFVMEQQITVKKNLKIPECIQDMIHFLLLRGNRNIRINKLNLFRIV